MAAGFSTTWPLTAPHVYDPPTSPTNTTLFQVGHLTVSVCLRVRESSNCSVHRAVFSHHTHIVPITALLHCCRPPFWPHLCFKMGYEYNSLAALLLAIILYFVQQRQRRNTARRQRGCATPVQHQPAEPFFGMDFIMKIHQDIPSLHRFHQDHGHSFQLNTLISLPTIYTVAPRNIKVIHTDDDKWGIEPARLPGMEPFCGRGFLTMDGDVWRHARRALRPSFAKSNLLDLSLLSRQVDKVVADLPKNGGVVDLQPLFYVTVRLSFWPRLLYYMPLTDTVSEHVVALPVRAFT